MKTVNLLCNELHHSFNAAASAAASSFDSGLGMKPTGGVLLPLVCIKFVETSSSSLIACSAASTGGEGARRGGGPGGGDIFGTSVDAPQAVVEACIDFASTSGISGGTSVIEAVVVIFAQLATVDLQSVVTNGAKEFNHEVGCFARSAIVSAAGASSSSSSLSGLRPRVLTSNAFCSAFSFSPAIIINACSSHLVRQPGLSFSAFSNDCAKSPRYLSLSSSE